MSSSESNLLDLSPEVDRISRSFDRVWGLENRRPDIGDFLSEAAEDLRSRLFVELVAIDWEWRVRHDEAPTLGEYQSRFESYAHLLDDDFVDRITNLPDGDWSDENVGSTSHRHTHTSGPPPESIDEFQIVREVGRGGMGIVYEAHQPSLGRTVALKILPHVVAGDARRLERFQREAQATARLRHSNIASVFGSGQDGDLHYIAMDFIDGVSLSLKSPVDEPTNERQPRPADTVFNDGGSDRCPKQLQVIADIANEKRHDLIATIGREAGKALDYAHAQGILHRDVKPSNLMLDREGNVWLTDFGLARELDEITDLTESGELPGTMRFLPPEALDQSHYDARSDVYCLGLTLFELLALRPAFDATSRPALLKQMMTRQPRALRRSNHRVPRDLETIVMKAISFEPSRRYKTAGELADDLQRFLERRPIHARRITIVGRIGRWCRRHPLVAGLLTALLTFFCVILVVLAWVQHQQKEVTAFLAADVLPLFDDLDEADPNPEMVDENDIVRINESLAILLGAKDLIELDVADPNAIRQVHSRIDRLKLIQKRLNLVKDLDELQLRSRVLRVEFELTHWGERNVNKYYVRLLKEQDLDVEQPPDLAIKAFQRFDPRARKEMVVALNHWFITMKKEREIYWPWLRAVLNEADTDAWRRDLRDAIASGDRNREATVLGSADVNSQDTRIIAAVCFCDGTLNRERGGLLEAAYDANPTEFWINHTRALRAIHFYQTSDGVQLCGLVHAMRPGPMTRRNLAIALTMSGRPKAAVGILQSAIQDENAFDLYALYDALAQAHFGAGNLDLAIEAMTQAVELKRSNAALIGRMCEYLFAAGRLVEAETLARENIADKPSYKSVVVLAKVLRTKDESAEAIQVLEDSESHKLRLDERAPIRDLLYQLLGEAKRSDEQSTLEPQLLEALRARLQMYRNKRFVQEIRHWSQRILRIKPDDAFAIECMRLMRDL